jgi:DNA-binding response OmpR family regulator
MRVLVIEDEFLIGLVLEQDLRDAGHEVVGPFRDLPSATQAIDTEQFDIAILDINLNGQLVYPLADKLTERGVRFFFLSGYLARDLPIRFREIGRLSKPYDPQALSRLIAADV